MTNITIVSDPGPDPECKHERTTSFIFRDSDGSGDGEIVCLDCLRTTHAWSFPARTTEAATSSDLVGEQHDDNLVEGTPKGDAFIA